MADRIVSPREILFPWQRRWVEDLARFKAGIWSRQTGKDFSSAEEIVQDCLRKDKNTWLIGAPSERQSLETLAKCREWAEAYQVAIADAFETRVDDHSEALLKAAEIRFANGSRIIAVPGRPDTVRGFSANVLLTEFAFFEDPEETWRAVLPTITNPLRGGEKKMRIISTPNGKAGRFFQVIDENLLNPVEGRKMRWSVHKVTIHDAIREGLPIDIEQIREGMGDAEGFAQEYECEFLDTASVLLPYDLIAQAEAGEATEVIEPSFFSSRSRRLYLGIDFGRQNDPTVCWTLEQVGDVLWTREVLVLRQVDTPDQLAILRSRVLAASHVAFDYTGPGVGLGDLLVKEPGVGQWDPDDHKFGKVELCTFTANFKREMFPKLRTKFQAPTKLRVPISRAIREDLHAMQQVISNGQYNYWAPRGRDGHSDRCTALALAVHGAGKGVGPISVETVKRGERPMKGVLL